MMDTTGFTRIRLPDGEAQNANHERPRLLPRDRNGRRVISLRAASHRDLENARLLAEELAYRRWRRAKGNPSAHVPA